MDERAIAFAELLERERHAALHAKLDVLTEVQTQKRALLSEMQGLELESSDAGALIERAQENIGLIRHLVVCLRGCLGDDATAHMLRHDDAHALWFGRALYFGGNLRRERLGENRAVAK